MVYDWVSQILYWSDTAMTHIQVRGQRCCLVCMFLARVHFPAHDLFYSDSNGVVLLNLEMLLLTSRIGAMFLENTLPQNSVPTTRRSSTGAHRSGLYKQDSFSGVQRRWQFP